MPLLRHLENAEGFTKRFPDCSQYYLATFKRVGVGEVVIDKALLHFRSQVVLQDAQCAISPIFIAKRKYKSSLNLFDQFSFHLWYF